MKDRISIKSKTASDYGEIATNTPLRRALMMAGEEHAQEITDRDFALLNETVYGSFEVFKHLAIRRYYWLKKKALEGSSVASCIVIDIETAIKFAGFTAKEEKIIRMWMQGYTQEEIAVAVYEYRKMVYRTINKCVERIQYVLVYLNPYS